MENLLIEHIDCLYASFSFTTYVSVAIGNLGIALTWLDSPLWLCTVILQSYFDKQSKYCRLVPSCNASSR